MTELVDRLSDIGLEVYSEEDLDTMVKRKIVQAMKEGRFSDALPDPYVHEIAALAKQSIADGSSSIVIQILTKERGLATFMYDIDITPTGITIGWASDWYIPRKAGERKVPRRFEGIPRLAINVSEL